MAYKSASMVIRISIERLRTLRTNTPKSLPTHHSCRWKISLPPSSQPFSSPSSTLMLRFPLIQLKPSFSIGFFQASQVLLRPTKVKEISSSIPRHLYHLSHLLILLLLMFHALIDTLVSCLLNQRISVSRLLLKDSVPWIDQISTSRSLLRKRV